MIGMENRTRSLGDPGAGLSSTSGNRSARARSPLAANAVSQAARSGPVIPVEDKKLHFSFFDSNFTLGHSRMLLAGIQPCAPCGFPPEACGNDGKAAIGVIQIAPFHPY